MLLKIKVSVEPCLVRVVVLMRGCSGTCEYEGGKEKITVYSLQKTRSHHWFKRCSIDTKGSKVCQENIPHIITPPPPAWTIETRQDGSMLSCSLCQILTLPSECCSRNRDSSDQATFFQSSIFQFWWTCANCRLRFLFLGDRSGTRCGLLLL